MRSEKISLKNKPIILMVDDNPTNLSVLGHILKGLDTELSVASSGEKALEIIKETPPDLILLDVMMPLLNGFEVCTKLKENENTRDIPIIFITALTDKEDIVRGFELGAVDYVTKPFNPKELLARVRTHLELKQAHDNQARLIEELQQALADVKRLKGLLPICAHCKKVRNDTGYWQQVETYIESHSEAQFSHGICPDCVQKYYAEYADRLEGKRSKE